MCSHDLYYVYVDAAYCYRRNSDYLSVTIVSPTKTAEPIKMSFGMWIHVRPRKYLLDGGALWRNLVNTIEPYMCCGDAAFLSKYFDCC